MELVLTEKRGGGYQAHRPTCKKIGDKEQFDAEELTTEALGAATPCSSCKPKEADMDSMLVSTPPAEDKPMNPAPIGEPASEGEDDEWDDTDDLLGLSESPDEDDLIGESEPQPVTPADPPKVKAAEVEKSRKAPKAVPASASAQPKEPELKAEQATELLNKVANHLSIELPDGLAFPGFGKAVKTEAKQTVYLNSKGTADVRANSADQASQWVEEGLAERRGGNYVRVNVRNL